MRYISERGTSLFCRPARPQPEFPRIRPLKIPVQKPLSCAPRPPLRILRFIDAGISGIFSYRPKRNEQCNDPIYNKAAQRQKRGLP